jgi:hypothetical protein
VNLPPTQYLVECSVSALQELELKSLDLAAQCEKRAKRELAEAVSWRGRADVYRFLIDHRDDLVDLAKLVADGKQRILHFTSLDTDDILLWSKTA